MILEKKNPNELLKQAQSEGMILLIDAATQKMKKGLTSIEEISQLAVNSK
jgi:type II secretory ATPase GspE/PulE/Tfp pilus assembly ATPase PilB-like protein